MDLKLTASGDLAIENGDFVLIDGVDAIAQDCRVRLKFFLGEWFLDQRLGVPWFQKILGQKPRLNAVSQILQKAILTTPGIQTITDFVLDFEASTRKLSVSFTGESEDGSFEFTTELIV